jgi:hypothetical protein
MTGMIIAQTLLEGILADLRLSLPFQKSLTRCLRQYRTPVRVQVYDTPVANTSTVHQSPTPRPKPKPIQTNPINPPTPKGAFNPKAVELPLVLETKEFREAWASWCDYRGEARKRLKQKTARAQLIELASWRP